MRPKKRGLSNKVTPEMAAKIKTFLDQGQTQHSIAAHFGINQGRVNEIKQGKRYQEVDRDPRQLPLL